MLSNLVAKSIKRFVDSNNANNDLYTYLTFYDELRELDEVEKIYRKLHLWLKEKFNINFFKVLIQSKSDKKLETEYQSSLKNQYKDFEKAYSVEMSSDLTIMFIISFSNEEDFNKIPQIGGFLNTLFYMTAPLISSVSYQLLVKELAFKDGVTQTYNRKFLVEHLDKILPLAKRENKNVSFLMIGIDHFKAVIDEFDYDIGDKLLIDLAKILTSNVRESDLVVKLDQDTFLITLVSISQKEDAKLVAQKLVDKFAVNELKVNENGQTLKKTICVGITHYDYSSESVDDIIRTADISLYEAKNKGRSIVKEYLPNEQESIDFF